MLLLERFMTKVEVTDDCWLWQGATNNKGYGVINIDDKTTLVHRFIYKVMAGDIPEGMYVCHTCDTPTCVNPFHLFLGTPCNNQQDSVQKGRKEHQKEVARITRIAWNKSQGGKPQCKRGHENWGINSNGHRYCVTCNKIASKAWYERRKQLVTA